MREVKAGERITDANGTWLMFTEDVAEAAGVIPDTIRGYHSDARKRRRQRKPSHFPPQSAEVRRTSIKANGQPVTAVTPVWREDVINGWLENRLGPGGRPRHQNGAKLAS